MINKLRQNQELWDLFTKKEEYNPDFTDQYERFQYYLSSHKDIFQPNVSKFLIENGLKPEYPDEKKFAVCLTHDIDVVFSPRSHAYYGAIKSLMAGQMVNSVKMPFYRINKKWNPLWNFKDIIEIEEKFNAKSSFYFLALDPADQDYNYRIEDMEHELGYITDKGWEVGLHGGHESYNDLEDIIQRKQKLEKIIGEKVIGYRNHYLRFRVPDTWELLSKAGFKYDTTFGYADCAGFRNGMCHPFKPLNLMTNKTIDILEIPLTLMDCTLFGSYMRLDYKKAWELTKQLIDTVENYNGVITILWHNTFMQEDNLKFYKKILQYCSEKNAWITSVEEIFEWWNNNVKN